MGCSTEVLIHPAARLAPIEGAALRAQTSPDGSAGIQQPFTSLLNQDPMFKTPADDWTTQISFGSS